MSTRPDKQSNGHGPNGGMPLVAWLQTGDEDRGEPGKPSQEAMQNGIFSSVEQGSFREKMKSRGVLGMTPEIKKSLLRADQQADTNQRNGRPLAQCPVPSAQCPVPSAQYPPLIRPYR